MCDVGCRHVTCRTAQMPDVGMAGMGRIWSIVGEMETHVGNMLGRLSRIEHESRQMAGGYLDWAQKECDWEQNSTWGMLHENADGAGVSVWAMIVAPRRRVGRGNRVQGQVSTRPWGSWAPWRPRLPWWVRNAGHGDPLVRARGVAGKATEGHPGSGFV
jgi:hypothetical protein